MRIGSRPSPPALFFACLLSMEALHFLLPGPRGLPWPWALSGWILVAGGIWLHAAAFGLFRRRSTTRATLAVPRLLVAEGPFRWSRNPMYLAGVAILLGFGLVLGSATPFLVPAVFWLAAFRWYIRPEEELLAREFGEDYAAYRRAVRRWL